MSTKFSNFGVRVMNRGGSETLVRTHLSLQQARHASVREALKHYFSEVVDLSGAAPVPVEMAWMDPITRRPTTSCVLASEESRKAR